MKRIPKMLDFEGKERQEMGMVLNEENTLENPNLNGPGNLAILALDSLHFIFL